MMGVDNMNDFEDISKMLEKVLSDENSKKKLMQLAEGITGNLNGSDSDASVPIDVTPANLETADASTANIQNIYKTLTGGNDKRVRLLNALKPYISSKHSLGIDNAITIVQLATISSNLGINKIFDRHAE